MCAISDSVSLCAHSAKIIVTDVPAADLLKFVWTDIFWNPESTLGAPLTEYRIEIDFHAVYFSKCFEAPPNKAELR